MKPTQSTPAPAGTTSATHSAPKRRKAPRKTPTQITDEKEALARRHLVHVGVDTGKSFHKLVARSADGSRTKAVRVEVSREGFERADRFLLETYPGVSREQMLVGVEFAGHNGFTFAYFLAKRGYKVVSVLPAVTKRHKADEDNSPRKDDDKDAAQICKLLSHGLFVSFPLLDERGAELRLLATERQRLAVEETRLKNRLQAALDLAWPEFAGQFSAITHETPLALLERWPVAADLADAAPQAVHALVKKVSRNHVKAERVRGMLASARTTIALEEGTEARRAEIQRIM